MYYRFGLDFFLSDYFVKYVDIYESDDKIIKATSYVKKEIFETKKTTPVMWDRLQKKALLEAHLAFIIGLTFIRNENMIVL